MHLQLGTLWHLLEGLGYGDLSGLSAAEPALDVRQQITHQDAFFVLSNVSSRLLTMAAKAKANHAQGGTGDGGTGVGTSVVMKTLYVRLVCFRFLGGVWRGVGVESQTNGVV